MPYLFNHPPTYRPLDYGLFLSSVNLCICSGSSSPPWFEPLLHSSLGSALGSPELPGASFASGELNANMPLYTIGTVARIDRKWFKIQNQSKMAHLGGSEDPETLL